MNPFQQFAQMIMGGANNPATGGGASPLGAMTSGHYTDIIPALQRRAAFFNAHPQNISIGGEMQAVNPSGFAGALPTTQHDPNFMGIKTPPNAVATNTPGVYVPSQNNPDALLYEQTMNQNPNSPILDQLAAKHPGDNTFLVHKTLQSLVK